MTAESATERPEERLRRVQRTGVSSLSVTLPKSWTEAHGVRSGSILRFQELAEGHLEFAPAAEAPAHAGPRTLHIDATGAPPALLARLMVGAYITGQDQVIVTARHELSAEARSEVDRIARRVLGMSLIEDEPDRLEVQVFLDATKHRLPSLVDRVVRMIRLEIELCETALREGRTEPLGRIPAVEEEVDRFYLLMARQILLASNDFHIAHEIGVPSHHYQFGYRIVAKMLEVTADLVAAIGEELERGIDLGRDGAEVGALLHRFDEALQGTMRSFTEVSPTGAHAALVEIDRISTEHSAVSAGLIGRSRDKESAARHQRILSTLCTALEMLTIINEITINRAVEPETIAHAGGRALVLRGAPLPRPSVASPA